MLSLIIWVPLLFGLLSAIAPKQFAARIAGTGAVFTLVLVVAILVGFDPDGGMQYVTDVEWIPGLGVNYSLGVDGISIFLVLLTAIAWVPAIAFSASRSEGGDRPGLYYMMLLAGETATLGAFLAQDLLLFVLFFDLMIVPFYFLFGIWGKDRDGVTVS
ncbi:MAG: NADH-quinone oxidoreductase subunit M, partial [Solirubrobacterales bacterium]